MTRGIAPLINGYRAFDKKIKYHGLILNKVNGSRHENKLIASIEKYSDIKVLGSVWKNKDLSINEQHLGLQPNFIDNQAHKKVQTIKKVINASIDISKFTNSLNQIAYLRPFMLRRILAEDCPMRTLPGGRRHMRRFESS